MTVWLGAPDPLWLEITTRPLFVSHNRLRARTLWGLPYSCKGGRWALDSGGFTVMGRYQRPEGIADDAVQVYPDGPEQYARAVFRYMSRIGNLVWASIQDWMCEPQMLARTGLTVAQHQERTVRSFLDLVAAWDRVGRGLPCPFRPALQGDTPASYVRCAELYAATGADLAAADLVGLGSVCRRSRTREIAAVVAAVVAAVPGIRLHGYGVKTAGLRIYGAALESCDSMAWSYAARARKAKHPACTAFHPVCSSCLVYAADWHDQVTAKHTAARTRPAGRAAGRTAGSARRPARRTRPAGRTPMRSPHAVPSSPRPAAGVAHPAHHDPQDV